MMLRGLVNEFIDSNFLARESTHLARLNTQLKSAVAINQGELARLQSELLSTAEAKTTLENQHRGLTAEIKILRQQLEVLATARATTEADLNSIKAKLEKSRAELSDTAAAAASKAQTKASLTEELKRLQGDLERAESSLKQTQSRLTQDLERSKVEHAAKLEALEAATVRRAKSLDLEIQTRQDELTRLEAEARQIKERIITEAEEQIDIARRQFENERNATINELEADRLAVHKELTIAQEAVIEKYRPMIEEPWVEQVRLLEIELGKTAKQLTAKKGDDLIWNPDQIREFLLDIDADGDAPSHLRICGATKSGKSYLVNQIISGGLKSLGFDADFTVIDPYHSQTKWAVPPTVKNDPDAAAALIMQWAEACSGEPLTRPHVLVVDELDSLITDYGPELADALKVIVKKGRHFNRYLFWLGQNGNAPKKFQWSDVKNFNQIYIGSVADDYAENGLKARNRNRWLGELEALRDRSRFHAIIHCKGANPYTRLLPREYFTTTTPPGATAEPAAETTTAPATACPKCGSSKVKKSGNLNGRQRIKCNSCGKQSYAN